MHLKNSESFVLARHYSKQVSRTGLFRFTCLLAWAGVLLFQIFSQSTLTPGPGSGMSTVASFIPHMGMYIFSLVMTLSVIFLAGSMLDRFLKLDTLQVIHARETENREFVDGMFWGIFRCFMGAACVIFLFVALLHLFATEAPFNAWIYIFYLLTLLAPSFVFVAGLSLFMASVIRHQGPRFFLLLGYFLFSLFYLSDISPILDPLGLSLPNAFSGITSHPDMGNYLLQRCTWLLFGIGFLFYASATLKRLANQPGSCRRLRLIATLFIAGGLLCGAGQYLKQYHETASRQRYQATYVAFEGKEKATLVSQELFYRSAGNNVQVNAVLTIRNDHGNTLNEVVLYLNPSLKIQHLSVGDTPVKYERENQVVRIDVPLESGECTTLRLEYKGKVDARTCYLDLPENQLNHLPNRSRFACRYGKQYGFLGEDYTLLIPEMLWYPVTHPPVHLQSRHEPTTHFTHFSLKVLPAKGKTVISQGSRSFAGDTVVFANDHPLSELSLCIGNYTPYSLTVDSVSFELYLHKGHETLLSEFREVGEYAGMLLSDIKRRQEDQYGTAYPFRYFRVVESPLSFFAPYRHQQRGSKAVQPGVVFIPERGVDFTPVDLLYGLQVERSGRTFQRERTKLELEADVFYLLTTMLTRDEITKDLSETFSPVITTYSKSFYTRANPYGISSLFDSHVMALSSREYPVVDMLFPSFIKAMSRSINTAPLMHTNPNMGVKEARLYLDGQSLKDAIEDEEMSDDRLFQVLKLKSDEFNNLLRIHGIATDVAVSFYNEYKIGRLFQRADFADFNHAFEARFGVELSRLLDQWYTSCDLPAFLFGNAYAEKIDEELTATRLHEGSPRYKVSVSAYNAGNAPGFFSASVFLMPGGNELAMLSGTGGGRSGVRDCELNVGEGKQFSFIVEKEPTAIVLNMPISRNFPESIRMLLRSANYQETRDTTTWAKGVPLDAFLPAPGEIVVDSEDAGCYLFEAKDSKRFFQRLGRKDTELSYHSLGELKHEVPNWTLVIDQTLYGGFARSGWVKTAGSGNGRVEWRADLPHAGEYEVFTHVSIVPLNHLSIKGIPPASATKNIVSFIKKSIGTTTSTPSEKISYFPQRYTIFHAEGEKEVTIPTRERGWVSMGTYSFAAGENKISLSDIGDGVHEFQPICADAVKWVPVKK